MRFLMILVALASAGIYVGLIAWRTVTYRIRAESHRQYLNSGRSLIYDSHEMRRWHERMQRNYEVAASRPWRAAETEPPPSD